jgi:hypothetical protein
MLPMLLLCLMMNGGCPRDGTCAFFLRSLSLIVVLQSDRFLLDTEILFCFLKLRLAEAYGKAWLSKDASGPQ